MKKDGRGLEYASTELRADREIVITAMLEDESALEYADKSLQCDESLLREVSERRACCRTSPRFVVDPTKYAGGATRLAETFSLRALGSPPHPSTLISSDEGVSSGPPPCNCRGRPSSFLFLLSPPPRIFFLCHSLREDWHSFATKK